MSQLTRAERRRIAKRKPTCPLCRAIVGHLDVAELRGCAVHASCKARLEDVQQRTRAEALGLSIVDAGALLSAQ